MTTVLDETCSAVELQHAIDSGDRNVQVLLERYTDGEVWQTICDLLHDPLGFALDQALDDAAGECRVPSREEVYALAALELMRGLKTRKETAAAERDGAR